MSEWKQRSRSTHHRFVKNLMANGFTEKQAEVLASQQVALLNSNLATKADIESVNERIEALRSDTERLIAELRSDTEKYIAELRSDIKALRSDTEKYIEKLRSDTEKLRLETVARIAELKADLHRWIVTVVLTVAVAVAGVAVAAGGVVVALLPAALRGRTGFAPARIADHRSRRVPSGVSSPGTGQDGRQTATTSRLTASPCVANRSEQARKWLPIRALSVGASPVSVLALLCPRTARMSEWKQRPRSTPIGSSRT